MANIALLRMVRRPLHSRTSVRSLRLATAMAVGGAVALALLPASCTTKEPSNETYFQQTIAPVLTTSCVRTNTGAGCHVADAKGNAFGNLDLSSYAGVNARRDLLQNYGPYGQPAILVKNIPPSRSRSSSTTARPQVTTDIKHTGGRSSIPRRAATRCSRGGWQRRVGEQRGAPGREHVPPPVHGHHRDRPRLHTRDEHGPRDRRLRHLQEQGEPALPEHLLGRELPRDDRERPVPDVRARRRSIRWNYFAAQAYLGVARAAWRADARAERAPAAAAQPGGGRIVSRGGIIFQSPNDSGYQALLAWATAHVPQPIDTSGTCGRHAARVPGILLLRAPRAAGAREEGVHDAPVPLGVDVPRLPPARRVRRELLSVGDGAELRPLDRAARARERRRDGEPHRAKEPVPPGALAQREAIGIAHRGGPLFEDFAGGDANGALCDSPSAGADGGAYDYDNDPIDSIPALCDDPRVAPPRARAEPGAALGDRVREPTDPYPRPPPGLRRLLPRAQLHSSRRRSTVTGAITLGTEP